MELCLPVCVCASFGACCGLWRRVQVEAAWAAAAQVVISGVVALNAATTAAINGRFEQVDREVYRKVGEPGRWLFVAKDGRWYVGFTEDKDARKTGSRGWAHSVAPAGGMPPPSAAGRWKVAHGGTKWVEQTVEVECATLDGDGSFAPVRLGRREPTDCLGCAVAAGRGGLSVAPLSCACSLLCPAIDSCPPPQDGGSPPSKRRSVLGLRSGSVPDTGEADRLRAELAASKQENARCGASAPPRPRRCAPSSALARD